MYQLSDSQTDYILNDIRRRGVEMEDLQLNLLDHICCIIEQNLKEGEDFEAFYKKTIPKFFKQDLWEIEQETITLLTFNNYYAMKKTMITSGAISVALLLGGSFFKIMHWPGAGMMLVLGIGILTFLFLPLMFLLKAKEASTGRARLVAGLGTLVGILLCLSTLFKLMHWPGASILWITTSAVSILLFVPLYFFSGIRQAETRVNTIVTTIILVGATGLLFSLTSVRKSAQLTFLETKMYYTDQQLLARLRANAEVSARPEVYTKIQSTCEKLKEMILTTETGSPQLPADFEEKKIVIYEGSLGGEFMQGGEAVNILRQLKGLIDIYNKDREPGNRIPVENSIFKGTAEGIFVYSNLAVLNSLTQIQLLLASAELQKPAK
jgi:hypothetical protein